MPGSCDPNPRLWARQARRWAEFWPASWCRRPEHGLQCSSAATARSETSRHDKHCGHELLRTRYPLGRWTHARPKFGLFGAPAKIGSQRRSTRYPTCVVKIEGPRHVEYRIHSYPNTIHFSNNRFCVLAVDHHSCSQMISSAYLASSQIFFLLLVGV